MLRQSRFSLCDGWKTAKLQLSSYTSCDVRSKLKFLVDSTLGSHLQICHQYLSLHHSWGLSQNGCLYPFLNGRLGNEKSQVYMEILAISIIDIDYGCGGLCFWLPYQHWRLLWGKHCYYQTENQLIYILTSLNYLINSAIFQKHFVSIRSVIQLAEIRKRCIGQMLSSVRLLEFLMLFQVFQIYQGDYVKNNVYLSTALTGPG